MFRERVPLMKILSVALQLLIAMYSGWNMGMVVFEAENGTQALFRYALMVIFFLVSMILQTIIHEGGHLVFGLLTGYKFVSFRVLSFLWIKINEKILLRRYHLAGTLGQCLLDPPEYSEKMPVVLYNLGGVIANIITSVIAYILYFFAKSYVLRIFLLAFGMYGLMFAIANGLPLRTKNVSNDGMNLAELLREKDARKALWQQLKASALMAQGYRIKDMPEEIFEVDDMLARVTTLGSYIKLIEENRLVDEHQFLQANDAIEELLSGKYMLDGNSRNFLMMDRYYIDSLNYRQSEINDKEFDAFVKAMKEFPSVMRYEYTKAINANDAKAAEEIRKRFEDKKKTHPYSGEIESEEELFDLIAARG